MSSDKKDCRPVRVGEKVEPSVGQQKILFGPPKEDLHVPGAKDDSVKSRLDLVLGSFARSLEGVGEVGTFGANKYTDNGWKKVLNAKERYANAMLRHYFAYKRGEELDEDSGLSHLKHLAWNALAVLHFDEVEKYYND